MLINTGFQATRHRKQKYYVSFLVYRRFVSTKFAWWLSAVTANWMGGKVVKGKDVQDCHLKLSH